MTTCRWQASSSSTTNDEDGEVVLRGDLDFAKAAAVTAHNLVKADFEEMRRRAEERYNQVLDLKDAIAADSDRFGLQNRCGTIVTKKASAKGETQPNCAAQPDARVAIKPVVRLAIASGLATSRFPLAPKNGRITRSPIRVKRKTSADCCTSPTGCGPVPAAPPVIGQPSET
jgi:hypothetical protein